MLDKVFRSGGNSGRYRSSLATLRACKQRRSHEAHGTGGTEAVYRTGQRTDNERKLAEQSNRGGSGGFEAKGVGQHLHRSIRGGIDDEPWL